MLITSVLPLLPRKSRDSHSSKGVPDQFLELVTSRGVGQPEGVRLRRSSWAVNFRIARPREQIAQVAASQLQNEVISTVRPTHCVWVIITMDLADRLHRDSDWATLPLCARMEHRTYRLKAQLPFGTTII